VTLTREQLVTRARNAVTRGTFWGEGHCLIAVHTLAGAPSGTSTATQAWHNAKHKHPGSFGPAGTFEYWTGGSKGYGHIAISLGLINGAHYCVSTDVRRVGRQDIVRTASIAANWTLLHHAGYAEDVNGVWIKPAHPAPPAKPHKPPTLWAAGHKYPNWLKVAQHRLKIPETGVFDLRTKAAVRAYRKAHKLSPYSFAVIGGRMWRSLGEKW
jgi:hypothetical protein